MPRLAVTAPAPAFPQCAEPCGACTDAAGEVVEVLVRPGQEVAAGQVVAVVENNKTAIEVTAPASGTVAEIMVTAGEPVEAETVLMILAAEG